MTNKQYIQSVLNERGLQVGCYSEGMDTLSKRSLNRVLEASDGLEYTDVPVTVKGKKMIVEVATVDNEQDYRLISASAYRNQYGR